MKHMSKSKNNKITKITKVTKKRENRNDAKHSIVNTQSGGVKVVIGLDAPGPDDKPIEREVTTMEHFKQIMDTARHLEVISSSSLNSFVIKIHLADDREFFKSDMVGDDGKKLDFLEIMDATSGRAITEVIIKICIIGRGSRPRDYVFNQTTTDKRAIDNAEFLNEYETQRYLYSAMMSTSGSPFCPDAFGRLEVRTPANLSTLFHNIRGRLHQNDEFNTIFTYLTELVTSGNHYFGLIMMESVPGNYELFTNHLPERPRYVHKSFEELSEIICAINILTIYRGKLFLLDAHPNNWFCDPSLPTLSKVKAIDFGRVYRIHNEAAVARFLNNIKDNVLKYFARISCTTPQTLGKTMSDFLTMMCITQEERARILTKPLQSQFTDAANLLATNVQEVITAFSGNIFFSKPFSELTPEERGRSINLIHRLLLTLSLVDGFFNDTKFVAGDTRRSQQYESYKKLYETNYSTPDMIIGSGILMNFQAMDKHKKYSPLTKTYEGAYNVVYEYCQDRFFPDIRSYSSFKQVERSIARQSAIKLTPYARVAGNKLWDACSVVGDVLGTIGMETRPFLERHVMHPIFNKIVYNPTMWAAYKLNLLQPPPPPPRVFASSTGGGRRRKGSGSKKNRNKTHKRKYTRKCKHADK
jgi:hypothetical protein